MLLGFQRLHLRCTKERCPVGLAVSPATVDQHRLKQGLCTVLYHASGSFPACPSVHRLGDPGGLLSFLDALGVDRGGLCAVPCPVQGFSKAAHALAVQLVSIDKTNRLFCFGHRGGDKGPRMIYSFDEVAGYESDAPDDLTVTETKGGIGRAVIGAAVAGPVGAIVGAATAKTET